MSFFFPFVSHFLRSSHLILKSLLKACVTREKISIILLTIILPSFVFASMVFFSNFLHSCWAEKKMKHRQRRRCAYKYKNMSFLRNKVVLSIKHSIIHHHQPFLSHNSITLFLPPLQATSERNRSNFISSYFNVTTANLWSFNKMFWWLNINF